LLDDAYRTGKPYFASAQPVELRSHPDEPPSLRYLDFVYQPIIEADGSVSGIFVQGDDVTERKTAEDALLEADRRKDVFLAMLAHELRNPLAPIAAAAQLLQMATHDENRVRMASEIIGRQVQHMTGLVDDLLDVSRVSRGEVPLNRQPVDIGSVVSAAIEQVRPLINARYHRLELQQPPRTPLVFGDRKRLVQVFVNLLDNAAKYTKPGGTLALRLESDDDRVRVSVRDDGIGIEARLLPHIFDLFTQAKRSSDRSQGGLGVGLSLVRGILQLHGGSIEAHSGGPHAGSEFVVSLPRLNEPVSIDQDTAPATRPSGRPLQIMIVDDNRDAATTMAHCLRDAGHRVVIEEDPLRALKHVSRHPADVYLLDIGLPHMDGNELARRIRAQPHPAQPLLVAVTGYGQQASRDVSLDAGFDHYFVKPVDAEGLIRLMAAHGDAANRKGSVAVT
jgi:signal transduction histidine kinase/ActR/RegA family two-component response regulator